MGRLHKKKFDYIHFFLLFYKEDKGKTFSELGNMSILTFTTLHRYIQRQDEVELLGRFILPKREYFNYDHLERG